MHNNLINLTNKFSQSIVKWCEEIHLCMNIDKYIYEYIDKWWNKGIQNETDEIN